ncbi:MAG: class I SAM-dependent methyltransferase, partial [Actinobacteria bacterium]|nr:class I SAM-dependent methyltransferase [Actinomycetota bacterium]
PAVPTGERPAGCTYVGLDLSRAELDAAPTGAYDQAMVGDVVHRQRELKDRFDLVVTWQVLEHVKPLGAAIDNIHSYLRPGGGFVAQLSGAFSLFGLANQAVPHAGAVWAMERLLNRDPGSVFPAYYDKCWFSALQRLGDSWSKFSVHPRFAGATYFAFSPAMQKLYLRYEEWTIRNDRRNLATHYLLVGEK